jgi:hypothetical protein
MSWERRIPSGFPTNTEFPAAWSEFLNPQVSVASRESQGAWGRGIAQAAVANRMGKSQVDFIGWFLIRESGPRPARDDDVAEVKDAQWRKEVEEADRRDAGADGSHGYALYPFRDDMPRTRVEK